MKEKIIKTFFDSNGRVLSKKFKQDLSFYQEIIDSTSFLHESASFSERLYCIINDIISPIKCHNPSCQNCVSFISYNHGYSLYCSRQCNGTNPTSKEKVRSAQKESYKKRTQQDIERAIERRKKTNLERYGVENVAQHLDTKARISDTLKERHRDGSIESSFANPEVQKKAKEALYSKSKEELISIRNKAKETNQERYGAENFFGSEEGKEKIKDIMKVKYGAENPQQVPFISEKTQNTNIERYGHICCLQNEDIHVKSTQTMMELYGAEHPMHSEIIKENIRKSNLEKYGVEFSSQKHISPEIIEKLNDPEWLYYQHHILKKSTVEVSLDLGVSETLVSKRMNFFDLDIIRHKTSLQEREIFDFIKTLYDEEIKTNTKKIIPPFELDIYIPDKNIAIEFDGLYWHSYNSLEEENSFKHLDKTKLCLLKNIRLFHIFENEWAGNKKEIWKSIIKNAFGKSEVIYARNCSIEQINQKELVNNFLDDNHLQGTSAGYNLSYGLFCDGKLVQLITLGKPRFAKNIDFEIIRISALKNHRIIGGTSKLIKHFIEQVHPDAIICYADRRYGEGKSYLNAGFTLEKSTRPNYFYFKNGTAFLHSRLKFQKHKLGKILENFNPDLSESQNMFNHGYRRIWDCGHNVYIYRA